MRTARAEARLSAGCCSLAFTASVLPPSSPRLATRTHTERLSNRGPNRVTVSHFPHLRRDVHRADPWNSRRTVAGACWTGRSSSREIVGCPSSDVPARVHSPRARARVRTAVCRPQFTFRPCGISPLRRFTPQRRFRACCIPVADMGFAGFQGSRRRRPKATRTRSTFPPALHPSKVCSSSVAVPHRWGLLPS
jgi:hypothetical protein